MILKKGLLTDLIRGKNSQKGNNFLGSFGWVGRRMASKHFFKVGLGFSYVSSGSRSDSSF